MGTSDDVLKNEMDKAIIELEKDTAGTCPAHGPLAKGVSLLLQIKRTELDNADKEWLTSKTMGGAILTALIGALYSALKSHGLIP